MAALILSRLSFTEASGRPTVANCGKPWETSTSTDTGYDSIPITLMPNTFMNTILSPRKNLWSKIIANYRIYIKFLIYLKIFSTFLTHQRRCARVSANCLDSHNSSILKSVAAMKKLSHVNDAGQVQMVDVTDKDKTVRKATARGRVIMKSSTLQLLEAGRVAKGNVLTTAKIAGIMAAKKTGEFIPLCHPLGLTGIDIEFTIDRPNAQVMIEARVQTVGQTGVEMEALTAVSVAALTIYDMCKAIDREMVINNIMLTRKSGGKSGLFE